MTGTVFIRIFSSANSSINFGSGLKTKAFLSTLLGESIPGAFRFWPLAEIWAPFLVDELGS